MFLSEIRAVPVLEHLCLSGGMARYVEHYGKEPGYDSTMADWWPILSLRDRVVLLRLFPNTLRATRRDLINLSTRCAELCLSVWDDAELRDLVDRVKTLSKNPDVEELQDIRLLADDVYSRGMHIFLYAGDTTTNPMDLALKAGAAYAVAHAARASILSPYSQTAASEALSSLFEASILTTLDLSDVNSKLDMVVSLRPEA